MILPQIIPLYRGIVRIKWNPEPSKEGWESCHWIKGGNDGMVGGLWLGDGYGLDTSFGCPHTTSVICLPVDVHGGHGFIVHSFSLLSMEYGHKKSMDDLSSSYIIHQTRLKWMSHIPYYQHIIQRSLM